MESLHSISLMKYTKSIENQEICNYYSEIFEIRVSKFGTLNINVNDMKIHTYVQKTGYIHHHIEYGLKTDLYKKWKK